ncbi:transporter substrate-binding domain-containing protein [Paraglaciecola aquimarina]|uniref:Transporter substrate-binding domain-containing protein n=1 Tax=Paraglaciecola algarum TaxID=3050085 RepID=A0ABS9DDR7_9ALTE|nr:ABC transporter substrate-binding protein [Paraglaciecola sp. G1-23]MCF2949766.1 transporter substrate-binding domain-containing protein [Paraglaciecola sp. G1-23]
MNKRLFCFTLYILFVCFTTHSSAVYAAKKIIIGYIDLPDVLDSSGKDAPYNEFMARILSRIENPYDTLFIPSARSNYLLQQKRIDCVFPVIPNFYQRSDPTIFSDTTNKVTSHVFTLKNDINDSLENLNGKMVAYRKGLIFGTLFDKYKYSRFVAVESEDLAIKLLQQKRVDGYLAYYPDITMSLSEKTLNLLHFDKEQPLTMSEDKLECVDTKNNRDFMEKFNQELHKMKLTGELQQILGRYYNF